MTTRSDSQPGPLQRIATFLYLHPTLSLILLLAPPLLWLGVIYLGSLFALLVQSFFRLDDFSGQVVREFSLTNYLQLTSPANIDIIVRTGGMAAAVTLACGLIAFPLAYFIARYATGRVRAFLYLAVLLPLWSSYLVRVYSWRLILAREGILNWVFALIGLDQLYGWLYAGVSSWLAGVLAMASEAQIAWLAGLLRFLFNLLTDLGGQPLSFSPVGMFLVFVYVWLPYMILPIQAALERIPKSLLEAAGDLGARPGETFRTVILPLAFPGVVAGSIFTFSLTLGDYIIPSVIGDSSYFIGAVVLAHQGTSGNIPLAAAFTAVPMIIMGLYLYAAKRLGAFDAL